MGVVAVFLYVQVEGLLYGFRVIDGVVRGKPDDEIFFIQIA